MCHMQGILDGVPLDEVRNAIDEGALLQDLTKAFLAKIAQTDQKVDEHASWDVFFQEIEKA